MSGRDWAATPEIAIAVNKTVNVIFLSIVPSKAIAKIYAIRFWSYRPSPRSTTKKFIFLSVVEKNSVSA
jgi:hypothetical protein